MFLSCSSMYYIKFIYKIKLNHFSFLYYPMTYLKFRIKKCQWIFFKNRYYKHDINERSLYLSQILKF